MATTQYKQFESYLTCGTNDPFGITNVMTVRCAVCWCRHTHMTDLTAIFHIYQVSQLCPKSLLQNLCYLLEQYLQAGH